MIGDTDTHNAAGSHEEFNYTGKFAFENDPTHRLQGMQGQPPGQVKQVREFSSGGLAGVWAEENTRESIFDAMQRKETFGTSGTMIRVRFFAGWDFNADDVKGPGFVKTGYARGVPMGGDLKPTAGKVPTFMVMASKDPKSGNLDRIQIVKGWLDSKGRQHEKIYDVAWSGDRRSVRRWNGNGLPFTAKFEHTRLGRDAVGTKLFLADEAGSVTRYLGRGGRRIAELLVTCLFRIAERPGPIESPADRTAVGRDRGGNGVRFHGLAH